MAETGSIDHAAVAAAAKTRFDKAFDETKRLSDFVGMLTRMSFLVLLGTFVANDMPPGFGFTHVSRWCALLAIGGISIKLALMVATVVGTKITEMMNARLARASGGVRRTRAAWWLVEMFCLMAMFGVSVSLISYGARLAERLSNHTHVETQ